MPHLTSTLARVRNEISPLAPESDLILPGGERSLCAHFVHIQLPILQAASEGFGLEDSAFGAEGSALAEMAAADRNRWMAECHEAVAKGAQAIAPHLSRSTVQFFKDARVFNAAMALVPEPSRVATRSDDVPEYGIVIQKGDRRYFVPMADADAGRIGHARRLAGMGAGLYGAEDLDTAFTGDEMRGIAGNWTVRSLTFGKSGPAMLVANDWQIPAPSREAALAKNAVERFKLIHETRRADPEIMIPISPTFMPMDQATRYFMDDIISR